MKKQITCLLASTLLLSGCFSKTKEEQTDDSTSTQLNQEQTEMLDAINEAYIKTTSQSYTEITYIHKYETDVSDTLYINYLYAIDDSSALEFAYCFDYNFNELVNFHLTMPAKKTQSIESDDYSYTADYYFTNYNYGYIIYDINEPPSDISSVNNFQIDGDP